jgi:hypothetical protein
MVEETGAGGRRRNFVGGRLRSSHIRFVVADRSDVHTGSARPKD